MVTHTFNPNNRETQSDRSLSSEFKASLVTGEFRKAEASQRNPVSKKEKKRNKKKNVFGV